MHPVEEHPDQDRELDLVVQRDPVPENNHRMDNVNNQRADKASAYPVLPEEQEVCAGLNGREEAEADPESEPLLVVLRLWRLDGLEGHVRGVEHDQQVAHGTQDHLKHVGVASLSMNEATVL